MYFQIQLKRNTIIYTNTIESAIFSTFLKPTDDDQRKLMLQVLAVCVVLTEHFSLQDCGELSVTNAMLAHCDGVFFSRGVNGFDPSVLLPVRHRYVQQIMEIALTQITLLKISNIKPGFLFSFFCQRVGSFYKSRFFKK